MTRYLINLDDMTVQPFLTDMAIDLEAGDLYIRGRELLFVMTFGTDGLTETSIERYTTERLDDIASGMVEEKD